MMSSLNEKLEIAEKKKREGDLAYCVPDNLTGRSMGFVWSEVVALLNSRLVCESSFEVLP